MRLVFWNSIHLEVASDSFCFLINSSWLLVFIFIFFSLLESTFNLYCWKGIHFSQNINSIFSNLLFGLIFSFHFWFRDLLREFHKKYDVLLIIFFLLFLLFLVSEALLFVSFFWTSFHSLSVPTLGIWSVSWRPVHTSLELNWHLHPNDHKERVERLSAVG